jgi:hypothetical protein
VRPDFPTTGVQIADQLGGHDALVEIGDLFAQSTNEPERSAQRHLDDEWYVLTLSAEVLLFQALGDPLSKKIDILQHSTSPVSDDWTLEIEKMCYQNPLEIESVQSDRHH